MSTNYSGNSIKNRDNDENKKADKPQVKKVIKGSASVKKKSEMSKIASTIISEECKSIKEYAIYDVVIPVLKDTISQLVKGSIDMLFYGEVRSSSSRGRSSTNASRVSYRDYYDDGRRDDRRDDRRLSSRTSYDNIAFDYKEDAEEVLNAMDDIMEQFGVVRVADLFEMAGLSGNGYTDQNYGWTNIRASKIERGRDGKYYLKMTRPSPIR